MYLRGKYVCVFAGGPARPELWDKGNRLNPESQTRVRQGAEGTWEQRLLRLRGYFFIL